MTTLIPIMLFGWILVVFFMFALMQARRAALASFIIAWLFLPQAAISVPGLPDIAKGTVASFSVLIAVIVFDAGRLLKYRASWIDLPMLVWCLAPLASSLHNGLGAYDGIAAVLNQLLTWGIPYFIGRLYFNDLAGLRELAIGIFIGGLVYVPLCLIEIRFSPQLHNWVYGYHQHAFQQTLRFGGYRPMVFMQHGLMVGFWMSCASLIGVWLWASGSLRQIKSLPLSILVPTQIITTVLCKSTGAIALLVCGILVLFIGSRARSGALAIALALVPATYLVGRVYAQWSGEQLVTLAEGIDEERAQSLATRLDNEAVLSQRALQRPLFGWGGWGRWRLYNDQGKDITTSDSLWIIALGETGLVGLSALFMALLLPVVLIVRKLPISQWKHPGNAPVAALAVIITLYSLDNLINAMLNPIFVLAIGGVSGFCLLSQHERAATSKTFVTSAQIKGVTSPVAMEKQL